MGQAQRFSASVVPVEESRGWAVRVEIRDAAGSTVESANVAQFRFDTRDAALEAGWRLAESLIRRRLGAEHAA